MVISNKYSCIKSHNKVYIAGSCDFPMLLSLLQHKRGCVVAEVVAVYAVPCVWFGHFNAFLLLFQKEESEGTSATNVTRGTMELTGESAIF